MTPNEAIQEISNLSDMNYVHICKSELCLKCYRSSCHCKDTAISQGSVTTYHCIHCGAIRYSTLLTSSSTIIKEEEQK